MNKKFTSHNIQEQASLAKSMLWEQMHKYYQDLGPEAWQEDLVPYQITSNKILAHFYTALINAAIHDYQAKNSISSDNMAEPYYILELGAGHGKFSFYMCKFLENFNIYNKFNLVYIASDISVKNIESWQQHPQLQKYIKNQQLDFARFDATNDQEILLINSQKTIAINSLNNPIFVIANYLFDTLFHEAFKCKNKKLFISNININYNKKFSLQNFKYKYSYKLIDNKIYYQQPVFNKILTEYQEQLKQGVFLLPVGGLKAIENIKKFTKKDAIFLVADKGNLKLTDFKTNQDPGIAKHGSISFMVNFHAIARFFQLTGGTSFITANPYTDLKIGCFITGEESDYRLLKFIMQQGLYDLNPLNMINLCYVDNKIHDFASLAQILAILSLSKWDPDLFYDLSSQLLQSIEKSVKKGSLDTEQEEDLLDGLNLVGEHFFKLEKNQDLPFCLANIYYILEKYDLALKFFELSIQEFGASVESWYNIGLCYHELKKFKLSAKALKKALAINPKYTPAKKLLLEI